METILSSYMSNKETGSEYSALQEQLAKHYILEKRPKKHKGH